jgi:large subunit ribosomal protein L19
MTDMPDIKTGQIIRVHEKIQDVNAKGESRERIQLFEGLVIGVRGSGASRTFTIRKETDGYGVEKIFPISSPNLAKIEVVKTFKVRRAKLGFVKNFARRLKEQLAPTTPAAK